MQSDQVDVVHITSPNRPHHAQAMAALKAGKHVICEKPLAMTAKETLEICQETKRPKKQVFALNYNVRFYPAVLQLRSEIAKGAFGKIIHVNGSYFQDWLLKPTDYNWRLLPKEGGALRAVADIGTQSVDVRCGILQAFYLVLRFLEKGSLFGQSPLLVFHGFCTSSLELADFVLQLTRFLFGIDSYTEADGDN